jgi:hypothetical protein
VLPANRQATEQEYVKAWSELEVLHPAEKGLYSWQILHWLPASPKATPGHILRANAASQTI